MSQDWPSSPLVWLAAAASMVFLVLWWTVDDTFVWLFDVGVLVTFGVWMWETRDWPRRPLVWIVWLTSVVFLVLWQGVDKAFQWAALAFLFLTIALRERERRSVRDNHGKRSLRPR